MDDYPMNVVYDPNGKCANPFSVPRTNFFFYSAKASRRNFKSTERD